MLVACFESLALPDARGSCAHGHDSERFILAQACQSATWMQSITIASGSVGKGQTGHEIVVSCSLFPSTFRGVLSGCWCARSLLLLLFPACINSRKCVCTKRGPCSASSCRILLRKFDSVSSLRFGFLICVIRFPFLVDEAHLFDYEIGRRRYGLLIWDGFFWSAPMLMFASPRHWWRSGAFHGG